jgi:dienelactone hydrolase
VRALTQERNRLDALRHRPTVIASVQARSERWIAWCDAEIATFDAELSGLLNQAGEWQAAAERLRSVPGIGPITAAWLPVETLAFTTCDTPVPLATEKAAAPMHYRSRLMPAFLALVLLTACARGAPTVPPPPPTATVGSPAPTALPTMPSGPGAATETPGPLPTPIAVTFPSGDLQLRGRLYKPAGAGPFPAVLWNHGDEQNAGIPDYPLLAALYVNAGYLLFIPWRREQGYSPGTYMNDTVAAAPPNERNQLTLQLLETVELDDQLAGLAYLKTLPDVDTTRIAVSGASYGGIETILGAAANPGYRAAIDCAGGALSWNAAPDQRGAIIAMVQKITIPVFLRQAENDASPGPTEALGAEFARLGKPYRAVIYPAWHTTPAYGGTVAEGHLICGEGEAVWGADALAFLRANLTSGAKVATRAGTQEPMGRRVQQSRILHRECV